MGSACLEYLYEHYADLKCQTACLRFTLLHCATYRGELSTVEELLMKGADVNARSKDGLTPLHIASMFGNSRMVEILIAHGAEINCREEVSRLTPLHVASMNGNVTLVELDKELRRRGNKRKKLQLYTISTAAYEAVVEQLIKAGANLNAMDVNGKTALHMAIRHRTKVIRMLLTFGANTDAQDMQGRVPLFDAIKYNNSEGVKALLEFGMDANSIQTFRSIISSRVYFIRLAVFEHVAKLRAAKLPIASLYKSHIDNSQMLAYFEECSEEVNKLKRYEIDNGVSLYDLLHMSPRRQSAYTRHKHPPGDLKCEFPYYCGIIGAIYSEARRRKLLLELAKKAWYQLTNINIPDICVEHILNFLDRSCLKIMIRDTDHVR